MVTSTITSTTLHFTSLHFSSQQITTLNTFHFHFTALHFTALQFTALHFSTRHCTALHFTSHNTTTQHNTTQGRHCVLLVAYFVHTALTTQHLRKHHTGTLTRDFYNQQDSLVAEHVATRSAESREEMLLLWLLAAEWKLRGEVAGRGYWPLIGWVASPGRKRLPGQGGDDAVVSGSGGRQRDAGRGEGRGCWPLIGWVASHSVTRPAQSVSHSREEQEETLLSRDLAAD